MEDMMLMLNGVQAEELSTKNCERCLFGNTPKGTTSLCDLKHTTFPCKCVTLDYETDKWNTFYYVLEEA